jgi:hypothetical protein
VKCVRNAVSRRVKYADRKHQRHYRDSLRTACINDPIDKQNTLLCFNASNPPNP